jgi:UPF0176 protein
MSLKVAALYQFTPLPDPEKVRQRLLALCTELGVKGTLLVASEGINGTIAGEPKAIDTLTGLLVSDEAFEGRFNDLELKFSSASRMPFGKLKVKCKREIVTFGVPVDPRSRVGHYVDPKEWNALIQDPDVLVIDTRNDFEVKAGTFVGAVNPQTKSFREFPAAVHKLIADAPGKKIAMFCTGGIRCEKATSYLLQEGLNEVYHLKGGILKYLEEVPEEESRWQGGCFVFDERVALGHGLKEVPITLNEMEGKTNE